MRIRLLFALMMMYLACQNMIAQQSATIKSFKVTTDHIPGDDRRNDMNGSPCALIKVQVVDYIERIEGNIIGDIINKGVEKWVYMCKGSRNMKIHFKNHLPILISFRDYKINGLESNRVYELVINTPNLSKLDSPIEVNGNNLQMKVTPYNATISIWGDNYPKQSYRPKNDGSISVYLPYGRYHYLAKADGYNDMEGSVFVNDENRWEEIQMTAVMGTLIVECLTTNVEFFLNGKKLEKDKKSSLWSGECVPGQYRVEARRKGYVTKTQDVSIIANQTITVNMERLITTVEQRKNETNAKKQEKKKLLSDNVKSKKEDVIVIDKNQRELINFQQQKSVKVSKTRLPHEPGKSLRMGILTGLNFATIGLNSDADGSCSMVTSFHVGVIVDKRISEKFHIDASILFSQKGYEYKHNWDTERQESVSSSFLMLPVQLSYKIGKFQIKAGPYIGYGLGGEIEYGKRGKTCDTFDYYDALDYGMVMGVGLNLGKKFYVGVNHEMGLADYANRNMSASLGYYF